MGERIPNWWHDHRKTSSINSVYYLEVFEDGITFAKDVNNDYIEEHLLEYGKMPDTTKTFDYLPENGELIIFPPDLLHAAQPNRLFDYRYSLNMEVRSDNCSKELFDRVFKYGFFKGNCKRDREMTTQNLHPILMILKNLLTRVRTFLTDLFQGLYLAVYLGIRLLPLLVSLVLEKLSSRLRLSRTSWILILTVCAYISILKRC